MDPEAVIGNCIWRATDHLYGYQAIQRIIIVQKFDSLKRVVRTTMAYLTTKTAKTKNVILFSSTSPYSQCAHK